LDGITTSENRIVVMTTNHVEHLDGALIRPGRCDVKVYIGNPKKTTIARMFDKFFPKAPHQDRREFVNEFIEGEASMAQVQEKLLSRREQMYREQVGGPLFSAEVTKKDIIDIEDKVA
jgi:chaperone BCS1